MDRDEIERRDFPPARRGYDPAAVESHLRRVADEFDALGRAAAEPPRPSLAEGASTQVRAILEAAETSADTLREEAGRQASDHVERVEDAARGMLEKLDRLQTELDRLLEGLKSSAASLGGSLEELSRDVGTLQTTGPPRPQPAASPSQPQDQPAPGVAAANGSRSDDAAGARLVALNMALEGRPRDETARYLTDHYELTDVEALLDDVYSSAGR
jgi:DivIVA domain-containing protein